jgi:hypothetical protein
VKIGSLIKSAQRVINKRGGTESLKEDAMELKDIASSKGSFSQKAKEAAEAVQEPGAHEKQGPRPAKTEKPPPPA